MATVSNTCTGIYGSDCKVYLEYILNSQNIQNNTSNITLKLYAQATSTSVAAYNFNNNCKAYIKIDNVTKKSSTTLNMDFRNKKKVDMLTWTGNVTHNTDGKLTISISGNFDTNGPSSVKTGSVSKSWALTAIPRASSITCGGGNVEENAVININRANNAFTHTLTYTFQGLTGNIATKTTATSVNWIIPKTFYAKMPNVQTATGKIECQTYLGNNLIGKSTCDFTAKVDIVKNKPDVSATVVDVNEKTVALTGDKNKFIKYHSNAKVDITATVKNGATINYREVNCNGKIGKETSNILIGIDSGVFNVSCKDTRQLNNSISIKKELIEYVKLAFKEIKISRPSTTSNTVNVSIKGNYFNGNFGTQENTLSLKYRYKEPEKSWEDIKEYISLIPVIHDDNTFSYEGSLGDIYDFQKEYEFQFVIEDKLVEKPEKEERTLTRRNTNH